MDRLSMGWGMVTRPGKTRKKKEDTNDTQKKKKKIGGLEKARWVEAGRLGDGKGFSN